MITLALVGAGEWGKNYIKTAPLVRNCRLKYVCVRKDEDLVPNGFLKIVGYQNLSKYPDVQGIIIATPAKTHYQIAKYLLKKNYHLLIEKPLTTDYQQAVELAQLQQKKKVLVLVGHTYLYHPTYRRAKTQIKKIGVIKQVEFVGYNVRKLKNGLSCLWEWGPHGVSLTSDLVGKNPAAVTAWKQEREKVLLSLRFRGKQEAKLAMEWSNPDEQRRIILRGTKGSMIIDLMEKWQITPLEIELNDFVEAISHKRTPMADMRQGLLTVKVLRAAELSSLLGGKEVKLDEVKMLY